MATLAILQRLAHAKPEAKSFLHHLALQVVVAAQEGRLPRAVALAILYGKPNKKKLRLDEWKTTLIFDVSDVDHFPYRVADPAISAEWSRLLLASDFSSPAGPTPFVCGLTGHLDTPMDDKMPSPNLKILGPTYLMSMNGAIPCQTRYGQTSTAIFRVGKNAVQNVNETWAGVPNASKDQSDLLIAYLEEEPDIDVRVAGFFADTEPNAAQDVATYEVRTAQIYEALHLREKPGKDS